MRPGPAGARAFVAAVLGLLVSGCGLTHLQDLQFRVDDRLHFTAPADRAEVSQPVTLSWTMRDFRVAAPGSEPPSRDAGYFAVFVDQAPIRPGHTMKDIGKGDAFCERTPSCPDRRYLRDRQIYPTTETSIKLPLIRDILGDKADLQFHTITVVLMDTAGHRIGESAWERDVRIHRINQT